MNKPYRVTLVLLPVVESGQRPMGGLHRIGLRPNAGNGGGNGVGWFGATRRLLAHETPASSSFLVGAFIACWLDTIHAFTCFSIVRERRIEGQKMRTLLPPAAATVR